MHCCTKPYSNPIQRILINRSDDDARVPSTPMQGAGYDSDPMSWQFARAARPSIGDVARLVEDFIDFNHSSYGSGINRGPADLLRGSNGTSGEVGDDHETGFRPRRRVRRPVELACGV